MATLNEITEAALKLIRSQVEDRPNVFIGHTLTTAELPRHSHQPEVATWPNEIKWNSDPDPVLANPIACKPFDPLPRDWPWKVRAIKPTHSAFRVECGLDCPTIITPEDSIAIGKRR